MACDKYTLAEYQALSAAIASGAEKVKYGDKEVEYRSLEDMLRLQTEMERCLFPDSGSNKNNGRKFASFSKGTYSRGHRRCR